MDIFSPQKRRLIAPVLAALVFAALSLAMLPYPGLNDDEVFFSVPLYVHGGAISNLQIFGRLVPFMLLNYLGALKTWLYYVVFHIAAPSIWSVRLPMVLAGMGTVWLTWEWVRRIAGTRAAIFTLALLATDSVFILTNTFDWGPVALQHVLLVGGLLAMQLWLRRDPEQRDRKWLALAFFLWGAGLFDKALMIWPLIGLAVAVICVYPRELRRSLRRDSLAIAAVALVLGAFPLLRYNIATRGSTASSNTKFSLAPLAHDFTVLKQSLEGGVLRDIIVATAPGLIPGTAHNFTERVSLGLENLFGASHGLMLPALLLALICAPFCLQTRRLLMFILLAAAVTWLQMATNIGTGGSAHHVVLLWPLPAAFAGIALAGAADRLPKRASHVITAAVAFFACGNIVNTNGYLANLIRNGAPTAWTDATYRLAGAVSHYKSSPIATVDWGYLGGLRMLYGGELRLTPLNEYLMTPVVREDFRGKLLAAISAPDAIFIQHVDEKQILPAVNSNLRAAALELGYSEEVLRVVHDNESRPVFEIFRFRKLVTQN